MIQESPSFIWNLLKMIGNVFKISASATAIHPTKIPAQKPYTYKSPVSYTHLTLPTIA